MNKQTAEKLIALNKHFYQQVADSFSQTRSYSWKGWSRVVELIRAQALIQPAIIDLGCGNARFIQFAREQIPFSSYLGVDSDSRLLELAAAKFSAPEISFQKADIISDPDEILRLPANAGLVILSGVMHHVPGPEARLRLIQNALKLLGPKGLLVVTFWQFIKAEQYQKKVLDPKLAGIEPAELEAGDYLLDWKPVPGAYRYCHSFSDVEVSDLISALGVTKVAEYNADGPGGLLNKYVILERAKANL